MRRRTWPALRADHPPGSLGLFPEDDVPEKAYRSLREGRRETRTKKRGPRPRLQDKTGGPSGVRRPPASSLQPARPGAAVPGAGPAAAGSPRGRASCLCWRRRVPAIFPLPSSAPAACRPFPVLDLWARAGFRPSHSSGSSQSLPCSWISKLSSPSPIPAAPLSLPSSSTAWGGCASAKDCPVLSSPSGPVPAAAELGCARSAQQGGAPGPTGASGGGRDGPTSYSTCAKLAPGSLKGLGSPLL